MAGNINQKLKLLYLMKILNEQTDEEHTLTINDIIVELSKYDISAERKSIYNDMELLKQYGIDIICKKTKTFDYYIGAREFELPELKLLADAVQSSKFITKKKSNDLIKKIENLTSRHLAKQLQRQVFVSDRVKAINEKIYYNVDTLHNAITQNKQVSFKYFEYTIEKKKQYRKSGEDYIVSPFALSWVDDNYYLVSHYAKYDGELTHFRVDRMTNINILEEKRIDIKEVTGEKDFNIAKYSKQIFSMFSGEAERVDLLFHNSLINVVIDRFSEDVSISKSHEDYFIVSVEVVTSTAFMAWLFQFEDKVKILSPNKLAEKMKSMAEKVGQLY